MPVNFDVTVENICNIPTKFKMERPGGESSQYKVYFHPEKSDLGAKQCVKVRCTFIALTTGAIDDLLANKVFGCGAPLGFSLKAQSNGLSLEFLQLAHRKSAIPQPIGHPSETQYKKGLAIPPSPSMQLPTFRFLPKGVDCPLYERQKMRIVVRNLSAISAKVTRLPHPSSTVSAIPTRFLHSYIATPPPEYINE